jgi:porphobilinogen synthase
VEPALAQLLQDLQQGAVGTIVKPALPYLDVLACTTAMIHEPVAIYHVSGEYMMAIQAANSGLIEANDYFDEVHAAFRRCGARYVIGYAADHFLRWQASGGND